MIRMLGAMVDAGGRAEELVDALEARLAEARTRADNLKKRPRVFFEEWDDPLISGIGWVSELVSIPKKSGGQRILGVPTVSDRINEPSRRSSI
jgi:iron complex transport system substrate-binding protein